MPQGFHRADSLSSAQHELNNSRMTGTNVRGTSPLVFSSLSKPHLTHEIQNIKFSGKRTSQHQSRSHSATNRTPQNEDDNLKAVETEKISLISKKRTSNEIEKNEDETTELLKTTSTPQDSQSFNIHPNDSFA